MPASTSILGLPYPVAADAPAGHTQMQALAEAVEDVLTVVSDATTTASTATVSGTFAALGTSPSITIPVSGTWDVRFGGRLDTGSTAASGTLLGLKIGASSITDDRVLQMSGNSSGIVMSVSLERTTPASITVGTVVTLQARAFTSAGTVDDMYISARLLAL